MLINRSLVVGTRLFSVIPTDKTRGSGHKLENRKFHINTRKNFFTVRVTALEQAAQGGDGVFFSGDTEDPSGYFPA